MFNYFLATKEIIDNVSKNIEPHIHNVNSAIPVEPTIIGGNEMDVST